MSESDIPKRKIKIRGFIVECDVPVAKVGFLYLKIRGYDSGRIVFDHREDPIKFSFNQTSLAFTDGELKSIREAKEIFRDAICGEFNAIDDTFDRREKK